MTAGTKAASSATVSADVAVDAATATTAGAASTAGQGRRWTSVDGLDPAAVEIMNKPAYAAGQWAIAVRDLDSGEKIIELDNSALVEPGSVTKTYAAAAAWLTFGPDSTIVTPVKRTGDVVDGTLGGDLILVGQGDLTMGGRTKADGSVDFANLDHNDANSIPGATLTPEDPLTGLNDLAAQVKAAGITSVTGDVIVDDRLWDPHALPTNGPVTPIIINQNLIDFISTPTSPGQPAAVKMIPVVAPWTVTTEVRTVAAGQPTSTSVSSPAPGRVVLTGTIAADAAPTVNTYAFDDPETFARTAFIEALGRAGVTVTADPIATNPASLLPDSAAVDAFPTVAALTSLPLAQEATYVLKVSYNRGAETFICRLAVAAGSTDGTDGVAAAGKALAAAGLDITQATLVTGDGAAGNLITADNQVQLQTIMSRRPDAARWKAALPILGVDGSLAEVQADGPAKGKVAAKTGSLVSPDFLNGRLRLASKALGGYIDTKTGRRFAFAVIVHNGVIDGIQGVIDANDDVGAIAAIIQQSY